MEVIKTLMKYSVDMEIEVSRVTVEVIKTLMKCRHGNRGE